jgi:opacity protein-like surface antigen
MRRVIALAVCGLAAASLAAAALAQDPVKPELGGGPNRDYRELKGGDGEKPRKGTPEPKLPAQTTPPSDAGQGGASTGGGSRQQEDERKATESKEKAKKRPGYKDEAPSPRA